VVNLPKLPRVASVGGAGGLVTLAAFSAFGTHVPVVAWVLCSILAVIGGVWPQHSADRSAVLLGLLDLLRHRPGPDRRAGAAPGNAVDPPDPPGPQRRRRRGRRTPKSLRPRSETS
jgi:hypothetical protein